MTKTIEEIKQKLEELNTLIEEEEGTIRTIQLIQERSELIEEFCDLQESAKV